jgi:shikimate dehydrogenase
VSRHPGPPHVDVADFTAPPRPVDVLVSTIPAAAQRGVVVGLAEEAAAVFDVVYDPWPTPLAASAVARGQVLVSGLDLLVHQAAGQFSLMTGLEPPPLHILVEAGHSALEDR